MRLQMILIWGVWRWETDIGRTFAFFLNKFQKEFESALFG